MRFLRSMFAIAALPAVLLACGSVALAASPRVTVLFHFSGRNGSNPIGPLTFDGAGNIFGVTRFGGVNNAGVVFELSPPQPPRHLWTEQTIYRFTGGRDGAFPEPGLIFDGVGNLYGTASGGGLCQYTCGTVFRLSPPTGQGHWTITTLHRFSGTNFGDGGQPNARLLMDPLGNLYGTTIVGGGEWCAVTDGPCGDVFELSPPVGSGPWTISLLHSFAGVPDGSFPRGGLAMDVNGNLFGSTSEGGAGSCTDGEGLIIGCGSIFTLTHSGSTWTETRLFDFHPTEFGPETDPILARGFIFGAAEYDVYRLAPDDPFGPWNEVLLYRFPQGIDGTITESDPVMGALGHLFGATRASGLYGFGSFYRLTPPRLNGGAWTATMLATYTGGLDADQPSGSLVFGKDGDLYGATASSNPSLPGEIVKIRP